MRPFFRSFGRWFQPRASSRAARHFRPAVERLEGRTLLSSSTLVHVDAFGHLSYTPDARGNVIPDFSNVGYRGGDVPVPGDGGTLDVPVRAVVTPAPGAADQRIQAAINYVSSLKPDASGFRGAVLLRAGEYDISDHVEIRASGVVLRGEGIGPNGTLLRATGTNPRYDPKNPRNDGVVRVEGDVSAGVDLLGSAALPIDPASPVVGITDAYVPVGARSFHVTSTAGLRVRDAIIVRRPSPESWIKAIGMDQFLGPDGKPVLGPDGKPVAWKADDYDLDSDRVITALDPAHGLVTIDAPLTGALERQYGEPLVPGGPVFAGSVYRYAFPGRIDRVGVEDLAGVSDYDPTKKDANGHPDDEAHAWTFISLVGVENAWVRDVRAQSFAFSAVDVQKSSKWVTVENAANIDPVSQIAGGRRYSFHVGGQLVLVKGAYAQHGRHDFVLDSRVPGPNVFVDCTAVGAYSESGPHDRWATGALFDNVTVTAAADAGGDSQEGGLNAYNRGLESGSPQGWSGANMVFWNSTADRMLVEKPPTAQNWAIGDTATVETTIPAKLPPEPLGYFESVGQAVQPSSLYFAQLRDRVAPPHLTVDVTALLSVVVKPAATGGTLIGITNTSRPGLIAPAEGIRGPLLVVFQGLPRGVLPVNAAGFTAWGDPYVLVEVDRLLPGEEVTGLAHFRAPLPAGAKYTVRVFAAGKFPAPRPGL
jgi:hypothetical protein